MTRKQIGFPLEMWMRLELLANDRHVSPSVLIREAVQEYIERKKFQ